jgi:hypothetical protein
MNISLSRLIMGIIFLAAGIVFVILAITVHLALIIYGIIFFILGIVLLSNKKEDEIENRKDLKEKRYNK